MLPQSAVSSTPPPAHPRSSRPRPGSGRPWRATVVAVMAVAALVVSAVVAVGPARAQTEVRVNEALSSNSGGDTDSYGNTPDWIELHNPGSASVSLAGWSLTDDATVPTQWVFPAGASIGAGQYLVVFASDNVSTGSEYHASFKLASSGEWIGLFDRDQNLVSDLAVPALLPNHSYGIGSAGEVVFDTPTPGQVNGSGSAGLVADVVADPARGYYPGPITVTLTSPTPGTQIRYTTDDAAPTATTGTVYSGPITVSTTTTIRAAAFRSGWITDRPVTHTYVLTDSVHQQSVIGSSWVDTTAERDEFIAGLESLPTISIVTPGTISQTRRVETSVEWIDPAGGPGFQVDAGIHEVGGHSTGYPKDSWRLSFDVEYGEPRLKFAVFDGIEFGPAAAPAATEFKRLTLRMGAHDTPFYQTVPIWLRNRWGDQTMLELGHTNPRGRFVNVFLDGEYHGQYHLREHFDDHFMASYHGGDNSEYVGINRGTIAAGEGTEGWNEVVAASANWQRFSQIVEPVAYVDWMILNEYQGNYWDLTTSRNWRGAGPAANDASRSLFWFHGSDQDITHGGATKTSIFAGPASSWTQLRSERDPDFVALVNDRAYALLTGDGLLTQSESKARFARLADQIDESIYSEHARWAARFNRSSTPETWQANLATVTDTVLADRSGWTMNRLRGFGLVSTLLPPTISDTTVPAGTTVTLANPNREGTIWVATDGSDPRLPGGNRSTAAQALTSIVVDRPIDLKARVLNNTTWSALLSVRLEPTTHPDGPQVTVPPGLVTMAGWEAAYQIQATDPDGDTMSYSASGLPAGLDIDPTDGLITGRATTVAQAPVTVTVSDGTHDSQVIFDWKVIAGAGDDSVPVMLNEYNAVSGSEFLAGGEDATFGRVMGNGGDWLELLVTADRIDLRGWTIELWDRETDDGTLAITDAITLSHDDRLAQVASGTIIAITESGPEQAAYAPAELDWNMQARSATGFASELVTASAGNFDTNRHGFRVRVLDESGASRSPFMGETDQWRSRVGNVGADEVMALCGGLGDPLGAPTDYRDLSDGSTFGHPNVCDGQVQDLSGLRVGFRGDVDCDGRLSVVDALLIARIPIRVVDEAPNCAEQTNLRVPFDVADFDRSGTVNIIDAFLVARCRAQVDLEVCHDEPANLGR